MATELLKESFPVAARNFDKAGEVSSEIKMILKDLGINSAIIRRAVVVSFEAEMNVVMYTTRGGMITFVLTDEEITLEIIDDGPGIPDIDMAMTEGFSTASEEMREMGFGFGMGLPNIKKNCDKFVIESVVGKGTRVFALIRHVG
ncbi:MAG: ATP-binding protein [Candidatus Brocadiia bacterium]